jgi:hypothetical protein
MTAPQVPTADDFGELPQAMLAAKRWLVRRGKTPFYVSGEPRSGRLDSPEDIGRLGSFEAALEALAAGGFDGLGFALGPDGQGGCWQGIDLDKLDEHSGLQFIAPDLPGYVEQSPSGRGLHAIGYGRLFRSLGANSTGIEAYSKARYFTVTGTSAGLGELTDIADFVENRLGPLHAAAGGAKPAATELPVEIDAAIVADLRLALNAIRADDRDVWIRIGHALHSLGEVGRELWLTWSQTSEKYDPADAARCWSSFRPQSTDHRAVFAEAQRQGWRNPKARPTLSGPEAADDGAAILDAIHAFTGRFVAYPDEHAHVAHVLWIAHAHAMDAWETTPRFAALSPEVESGKTRLLEVTELLVPNPVQSVNASPAYMFRKIADEDGLPTILFDEIDTVFGPKARDNEEVRGILNAGYRRGATVGRCVISGKTIRTEESPAFCAVAVAGIGDLPDTILSRAIVVAMRRRGPRETVEPFRRRVLKREGYSLRDRLAAWIASAEPALADAWPTMPQGIEDRAADIWEPLLAIADAAGGTWPQQARVSAVSYVSHFRRERQSLGIRLLADLRTIFGKKDRMFTADIVAALNRMEEAPWASLRGGALDARGLARRLRKYDVKPKQHRIGSQNMKGYCAADLADAWSRYLSLIPPDSETFETSETSAAAPMTS